MPPPLPDQSELVAALPFVLMHTSRPLLRANRKDGRCRGELRCDLRKSLVRGVPKP